MAEAIGFGDFFERVALLLVLVGRCIVNILVAADWHYVGTAYVGLLRLLLQLPNVCLMIDPLVLEKVPFQLGSS